MQTENKVWFITGANKGIGAAIAKELLAQGYHVAATASVPVFPTREHGGFGTLHQVTQEKATRANNLSVRFLVCG
ncbi:MAG: SDR family NAD(P)-dependent oxidoreductase [Tannerellaceae bacterium]|nr:SDR family NAD(P)-dependent oxidoreductase [Tannerellaceae bacterium]